MKSPLLLESILVHEGRIPLLESHLSRVFRAAQDYDLSVAEAKQVAIAFRDAVATCVASGIYVEKTKCRVVYSVSSDEALLPLCIHEITMTPYTMRPIRSLEIVEASSLDYHHKYADRSGLNQLVQNKSSNYDDVLIIQNGLVTDTSYCNIVFEKNGRYVTPLKPLLPGVRRSTLIDLGWIELADIPWDTIGEYDAVHLINAMIDLGELTLDTESIGCSTK